MPLRLSPLWLALVVLMALCRPSAALSCTASIDSVNFGTVATLSSPQVDVTANVTVACTGGLVILGAPVPPNVFACANIGSGSGGGTAPRLMTGTPSGTLGYQLYTDPTRLIVWGTNYPTAFGTVPVITVALNGSGAGSTTVQMYARLPTGSNPAAPASYLSTFGSGDVKFDYGQILTLLTCALSLPSLSAQATAGFTVSANIAKNCLVETDNVSFGSFGVLSSPVTANGRVGVTCTPSTTYTVSLGNGGTGTGPTARKMTKSAEAITYGLYQDGLFATAWGSTIGSNTAAGTGSGAKQNLTVYGRVPAQATPSAGTYNDSVVVTITY
ncbi:MAG: spore coat protein U domain-containing protein [Bauldia sp.]